MRKSFGFENIFFAPEKLIRHLVLKIQGQTELR